MNDYRYIVPKERERKHNILHREFDILYAKMLFLERNKNIEAIRKCQNVLTVDIPDNLLHPQAIEIRSSADEGDLLQIAWESDHVEILLFINLSNLTVRTVLKTKQSKGKTWESEKILSRWVDKKITIEYKSSKLKSFLTNLAKEL